MRSNSIRAGVGLAIVVLAAALFAVLQGKDSSETSTSKGVPTIVLENGKPLGAVAKLTYTQGDRIHFKVNSDVSDEIHVHAYDLTKEVEAGGSASFDFPASIGGLFEVELEGRGEQIAELRVNP